MSDYQEEEHFDCPYCAAPNSIMVDETGGRRQTFTTDCEVCCHPMVVTVDIDCLLYTSDAADE